MNYKLKVTIPVVVCGGAVLAYYLIRRFVEFYLKYLPIGYYLLISSFC